MRRTRLLVAVPAALLLASGCGSHDAARPGLAAKVDDRTISVAGLDRLVDAECAVDAADPKGQPTTRRIETTEVLKRWIGAQLVLQYADRKGIDQPAQAQDLTSIPGWSGLSEDQRSALQSFATDQAQASAIAKTPGLAAPDTNDFDIVINPRYDLDVSDQSFVTTDRGLSVPVSDQAVATQGQPSLDQLRAMPASQVCGKLPAGS